MIALTFDDGPNPPYTSQILKLLADHKVKATFFVLGKWALRAPAVVRAAVEAGHRIGNHGYDHKSYALISQADAESDLLKGKLAIPATVSAVRVPFGNVPEWMNDSIGWDVHGSDWETQDPTQICAPIFDYCDTHDDAIVLLHDGYYKEYGADRSGTVEATYRILGRYPRERFGTVAELCKLQASSSRDVFGVIAP